MILSKDFLSRHRKTPTAFTRNRQIPFHTLIFFLMQLNKGSCQDELDNYFKTLNHLEVADRFVTKSAFTQARKQLKHEAFIELNDSAVSSYYSGFHAVKWHGLRLFAVDGSTGRLPYTDEIIEHFGDWNPKDDSKCCKGRISQMFDVLNRITVDAILSPKETGERELATQHFTKIGPNDLVLMDRGYPAWWLFCLILFKGADFCVRASVSQWNEINKFYKSGKLDKIVKLHPTHLSKRKCAELGIESTKSLKVRLIRVELSNGESEILITSLIDNDKYPTEIFQELYHHRWPVEEDYKVLKCRVQIENFSGKTLTSVFQDFHAKILSKNIASIIANTTKNEIDLISGRRKLDYQINFTNSLSKMKSAIVLIFNRTHDELQKIISDIRNIFIASLERIKKGRSFPRKHKIRQRTFYFAFKQTA